MPEGYIKSFLADRRFGFITPLEGGKDLYMPLNAWRGPRDHPPLPGERVTYTLGPGRQPGEFVAREVCPVLKNYFLNPYNFCRPLGPRPPGHVLGDCPPPPHDRYVGFTGELTCTLTTTSPLFIADAHDIAQEDPEVEHRRYRFFRYEGRPAIPASTLRGAIRSVYEAATNSCFSVFQQDQEERLEYRDGRDPGLIPARVLSVDERTGAELEVLDAAGAGAPYRPTGDEPKLLHCALIRAYTPRVLRTLPGPPERKIAFNGAGDLPPRWADQTRVAALVNVRPRVKPGRFQWFEAAAEPVEESKAAKLQARATPEQRVVFGYLHRTGPNTENKHDERLFFSWNDRPGAPTPYAPVTRQAAHEVVEEYDRVMKGYWERHQSEVEDLGAPPWPTDAAHLPHPSSYIRKDHRLKPGDLVYFIEEGGTIIHLAAAALPRLPHPAPREALLPAHAHPCRTEQAQQRGMDTLCPACRLFGWVDGAQDEAGQVEQASPGAYAGRLRFSYGQLVEGTDHELPPFPLAILGAPKPTATHFYLRPAKNKPQPGGKAENWRYDPEDNCLRGRKFYRHHGQAQDEEYRRCEDVRDGQNRTVEGVLQTGAQFTFTIAFENLAPLELDALLWALQLEEETWRGHHRLGMGKPLGFGSAQIVVDKIRLLNTAKHYARLDDPERWYTVAESTRPRWGALFAEALARLYGVSRLTALDNIRDLLALLGEPPDLPIHYPRSSAAPTAEGQNFAWFMGNKRAPNWPLALAAEDTEGLPLLGKDGRQVVE